MTKAILSGLTKTKTLYNQCNSPYFRLDFYKIYQMKLHTYITACLCLIIISCKGQTGEKHETIEPKAFAKKIDSTPNAQILDVRTPEEYTSEHIDNATNINWNGNDF